MLDVADSVADGEGINEGRSVIPGISALSDSSGGVFSGSSVGNSKSGELLTVGVDV